MSYSNRRSVLVAVLVLGATALQTPLLAQPVVVAPTLLVSGKIDPVHASAGISLDLAALERLPQHSFITRTPWVKEPQKFTGPLLRDVLALVKANGKTIKAVALNAYQITIPVDDALHYDVIVAHKIDDKPIPVRERGPLFIIYPFDQQPQLQAARYYERAIWQLKSLIIE